MFTFKDVTKKYVIVRTQFEGQHRWKNAPKEVSFLRNYHRHMFRVMVAISVDGLDRDLEYFMVLKKLNKFLSKTFSKPMDDSCELMAQKIIDKFLIKNYGERKTYSVEVSEDGENSSLVTRERIFTQGSSNQLEEFRKESEKRWNTPIGGKGLEQISRSKSIIKLSAKK